MSSIAFVLGNGESRKGIEINDLMEIGTVFACNAVYRTHRPHFLVAVDPKMILEIAETDYMVHNKVWSNFNAQYNKNQKKTKSYFLMSAFPPITSTLISSSWRINA